ncbi:MAG: orotate phosphoribosyltransferase, partial [Calditrichia bacterium]|nr:orotate phosphoribosyltransferase [Calditrichia bacterium]
QQPKNAEKICGLIADHFKDYEIDTVIAPALGGIVVGQEVARQLNKKSIFAERKDGVMKIRRGFLLQPGEKVLVTEDVVTTGGSVKEVIELVKAQGAIPVGIGFIVDRSGGKAGFGIPQFAAFTMDVVTWQPEECPLCAKDIQIEKPGSRK